jgi:hypothetical protein
MDDDLAFGFVGLGAMGFPMAARLRSAGPTRVWNRTAAVSARHAAAHGTRAVADAAAGFRGCALVALCLPTSAVSREILELLLPSLLEKPCVILDHTSGNPLETQALADYVRELSGGRVTCTWAAAESACFALLRSVWLVWLLWLLSVLCVLCLLLLFNYIVDIAHFLVAG